MATALRPALRISSIPDRTSLSASTSYICQQCRNARLLRRPQRPYTFTQLVTLSDGSAFTVRTTSPQPVYRCTRDTRNAVLWNPSSRELANIEDDEAGRLSGFRARYGTSFDSGKVFTSSSKEEAPSIQGQADGTKEAKQDQQEADAEFAEDDQNLLELISSFGQEPAKLPANMKTGTKKGKK